MYKEYSLPTLEKEVEAVNPIEIVLNTDFADPSVWQNPSSGLFEAVATETYRDGSFIHVQHAVSEALSSWELQPYDLFPKTPEWNPGINIWAPYVLDDEHLGPLLCYGAETCWGDYGISIARFDERKGYFVDYSKQPLTFGSCNGCPTAVIDPYVYRDDEGSLRMMYGSAGLPILEERLTHDATAIIKAGTTPQLILPPRPHLPYQRVVEAAFLDRRAEHTDLYVSVGDTFGNGHHRFGEYAIAVAQKDNATGSYKWRDEIDPFQSSVILEGNKRFKNPGNNSLIHTPEGSFLFYHVIDREDQYFPDFPGRTNFNRRPMARSRVFYDEYDLPYVPNGRSSPRAGERFT